jgi:hypothetical protein
LEKGYPLRLNVLDYLPFEEDLALYLNKLEFPHPRIICTKFDRIWLAGSGEDLKKISVYFYSFAIISPWRRANSTLHLNKLESPAPKDDLCQVWLKLAKWFWRRS